MGQTAKKTKGFDPNTLNKPGVLCLWFDDLGTGNAAYRFLSNFYEGDPITLPGVTWEALAQACKVETEVTDAHEPIEFKTGEHAFAAMKFWGSDFDHFLNIVGAPDPNSAKALGRSRKHPLRPDWEVVKLDLMAAITREKYSLGRSEAHLLLKTGDAYLCEGTYWADEVWGVALDQKGLPGRNWLGTLLMARRAELRALASIQNWAHLSQGDYHESLVSGFAEFTSQSNIEFSIVSGANA